MANIPTLETERLILRPPVEADFEAYRLLMASPRSIGMGGPYNLRGAWGMFCHDIACWDLYGHGALMIERKADGVCLGQVGINHGPLYPEKELGWLLYDGFEGQGYATEAATAMRHWGFEVLRLSTLVSYCDADNAASIAVAERLGAVRDVDAEAQDPGDLIFRHHAPSA